MVIGLDKRHWMSSHLFLCDNFPKLSDEERSAMEGRLTLGEASSAVSKLRNDKSPGPDGFSAIFFLMFLGGSGLFACALFKRRFYGRNADSHPAAGCDYVGA